jgi:hypothetical protein
MLGIFGATLGARTVMLRNGRADVAARRDDLAAAFLIAPSALFAPFLADRTLVLAERPALFTEFLFMGRL